MNGISQKAEMGSPIPVTASSLATGPTAGPYQACCQTNRNAFETIATCREPEQQNQYVYQMGKDLGQLMAIRLAEIVTELMQSVLQHPAKGLVDERNAPLLTRKFWVQAIYTELLHVQGRARARTEATAQWVGQNTVPVL